MKIDAQETGPITFQMMQAVLSWFCPSYSPPRTRAAEALTWTWDNVVAEQIVPLRMNGNVLRFSRAENDDA
jgi:hypothetical protein